MSKVIQGISHLNADELHEILEDPHSRTLVIDVREPHEYIQFHIPGIPLIPMGEIAECMDRMDKEREYVFVCRSGARSFEVARYFKHLGFEHVHNYAGGMLDWQFDVNTGAENIITDFDPKLLERNEG